MKTMLRARCGSRKRVGSSRPLVGSPVISRLPRAFRLLEGGWGLDKKLVPYSARHTYGTYTMEKTGNGFAVSKSLGHADLKSMEPYQHHELEPLRVAINQRKPAKKQYSGFWSGFGKRIVGANKPGTLSA